MDYKIDVSLSTNEVYTLTFYYTFDESVEDQTIRLEIGDLTIETQDRRVVFKTTSSVTQIKSNVRLENINLYEGNFEDYDQHGEYTKESYLKGRTLFNYITETSFPIDTTFQDFYVSCDLNDGKYYTLIIDVENATNGYVFGIIHKQGTSFSYLSDNITTDGKQIVCNKYTNASNRIRVISKSSDNVKVNYIMVIEGQYNDYFLNNIKYFSGIGCVKSPTIYSQNKYENLSPYLIKLHQNGNIISDDNTFIDVINTGRYTGVSHIFYAEDVGYKSQDMFAIEFDYVAVGQGTVAKNNSPYVTLGDYCQNITNNATTRLEGVGHFKSAFKYTGSKSINRYMLIEFMLNPDWNNTNKRLTISNLRLYAINSLDELGKHDNSMVTTPSDLELHGVNEDIYDKLDLTTNTLHKNIGSYILDETFVDATTNWSISTHETSGNVTFTSRQYGRLRSEYNFPNSLHGNAIINNADTASNIVNNNNIEITRPRLYFDVYSNNNYTVIIMPSSYNVTTLDELRAWLQNNNMIIYYKLQTPTTKQIDLKALRCYQNGSIVTDSQQLVPKLVTTLPISNKFETTKLVSGKTYNVYFDGTATELNVGGETVIAYPASPCEFTCGSTKTLTITGTDIANVMVIEKEQKNEQHEINATSIYIDKIITTNGLHNYFDEYQFHGGIQFNNDYYCTSTRERNSVKIIGHSNLNYAGFGYYPNGSDKQRENLPKATYKFHCKVKVKKIGDKYRVVLHNNPNSPSNANDGFATGEIVSTKLIEEINYIGYFGKATCMLFYTFYSGQEIEYYDISFIKLSDEDITSSSDIPNINYEETISTPSEPIVLRSYGGVQDTYDIATGIVTKRVSQSVDNFDLVELPSPEIHIVTFDNMPVIYENGTVEFYTEHDLYPIAKFEIPALNLYDVSNLEANKPYTIRNASQIFCNGQSVPVSDVMTFTASQLAKGEMVINSNQEPMIIEGDYGSRDIPSFKGFRSVEALEVNVNGAVNQPVFGKGGRK